MSSVSRAGGLDLDAIEARIAAVNRARLRDGEAQIVADVEALIIEVRALRTALPSFPVRSVDLTLVEYPATDACEMTLTPRFHRVCRCPTYPENEGACDTWKEGMRGHPSLGIPDPPRQGLCVYCDHEQSCHRHIAETPQP